MAEPQHRRRRTVTLTQAEADLITRALLHAKRECDLKLGRHGRDLVDEFVFAAVVAQLDDLILLLNPPERTDAE